ncbi:hypothetical protein D5S17_28870 [Pseudonocardiaceae bacterium YIM PH 21723]|nr:hypothetical protein D5S17_28870 [Pseudonocardiaceae bacterium YIM PH 21723]
MASTGSLFEQFETAAPAAAVDVPLFDLQEGTEPVAAAKVWEAPTAPERQAVTGGLFPMALALPAEDAAELSFQLTI